MKYVLVTGSSGFVGKNLIAELKKDQSLDILTFDIEDDPAALEEKAGKADFIFHLAGSNRPKDIAEYEAVNKGLTKTMTDMLDKARSKAPVLLASSIQAQLDNPYGASKKSAEEAVFAYEKSGGGKALVFRLPNIFGKWCRPNYNSVVATFCHNIANGLPITINDPATTLNLVYIDDVIDAFTKAMRNDVHIDADGFCHVSKTYSMTLRELADTIGSFKASRETLVLPDFSVELVKDLYATYLSYLPEQDFSYPVEMKRDGRGWLAELLKSNGFGQIFVSRTKPGVTRGNHWHHTKIEKFIVLEGRALMRFRHLNGQNVIEFEVTGENIEIIDIPVGYTHSITNIGEEDLLTLFWSNEIFDPNRADTTYLEV